MDETADSLDIFWQWKKTRNLFQYSIGWLTIITKFKANHQEQPRGLFVVVVVVVVVVVAVVARVQVSHMFHRHTHTHTFLKVLLVMPVMGCGFFPGRLRCTFEKCWFQEGSTIITLPKGQLVNLNSHLQFV